MATNEVPIPKLFEPMSKSEVEDEEKIEWEAAAARLKADLDAQARKDAMKAKNEKWEKKRQLWEACEKVEAEAKHVVDKLVQWIPEEVEATKTAKKTTKKATGEAVVEVVAGLVRAQSRAWEQVREVSQV